MVDQLGLSIPIPEEQVSVLLNNTEEFLVDFIILTKVLGLHASEPSLVFCKNPNNHHEKAKKFKELKDDMIIITANREIKTGPLGDESGIAFGIQKRYYFANKIMVAAIVMFAIMSTFIRCLKLLFFLVEYTAEIIFLQPESRILF